MVVVAARLRDVADPRHRRTCVVARRFGSSRTRVGRFARNRAQVGSERHDAEREHQGGCDDGTREAGHNPSLSPARRNVR